MKSIYYIANFTFEVNKTISVKNVVREREKCM